MVIVVIIIGLLIGLAVLSFIIIKFLLIVMLAVIGAVYFFTYLALESALGESQMPLVILGTFVIGSGILWLINKLMNDDESPPVQRSINDLCPCGSRKIFKDCHGRSKSKFWLG